MTPCAHHASPNTCHNGICAACSEGDSCGACGPGLVRGVAPGEHHTLCDHPIGPHSSWCRHNETADPNAGRLSGWNLEWNHTLGRYVTKDIADHIADLRHAYELKVADLAAETLRSGTVASQAALLVEAIVKIAEATDVEPEHIGPLTGPLALDLAGQVADRVAYLKNSPEYPPFPCQDTGPEYHGPHDWEAERRPFPGWFRCPGWRGHKVDQ